MKDHLRMLIYTCQSKREFYCRDAVCEYVLRRGHVPLNPFRVFDYFLSERVDRDLIRTSNATIIERSDEVWAFGQTIADGVFDELEWAHQCKRPIRLFNIDPLAENIRPIEALDLDFEPELYASGHTKAELVSRVGHFSSLSGPVALD